MTKDPEMFCFQCEQRSRENACLHFGTCGKDPQTAALQDLLVEVCRQLAALYVAEPSLRGQEEDAFLLRALFATVTNVSFDAERIVALVHDGAAHFADLGQSGGRRGGAGRGLFAAIAAAGNDAAALATVGREVGLGARLARLGAEAGGVAELLLYGVKGMAAYAWHARVLGQVDAQAQDFIVEALAVESRDVGELLGLCLRCGAMNLRVMAMLDAAHNATFGVPAPTPVRIDPVRGKAILVSGHDLHDLELLLEQTSGKGIQVYTHGEMLPAHGYPRLRAHAHLAGNYGGAWQDQQEEFEAFPGPILMTTNCIQKPKASYANRLFTRGEVSWPGVRHVAGDDMGAVIEKALALPGFTESGPGKSILTGFGHGAVLGLADRIVGAVKAGQIRRFFVVGGCDGAKSGRNYFTEFAEAVPQDCVVLTLGCGKYRFNRQEFGEIAGLPRLLDLGQCNDAYSAIRIALALSEAFGCGVNDLPLSLIISWFEQKAVCVLLTLLHLGVRDIRLGPSLPSFVPPGALRVLVEQFNLMPVGEAQADLAACLRTA